VGDDRPDGDCDISILSVSIQAIAPANHSPPSLPGEPKLPSKNRPSGQGPQAHLALGLGTRGEKMRISLKAKLVRLALAASLAFPVAGVNMLEAHAACYYGGYSNTISGTYAGTSYSSTVWYTVGFSCSGAAQELSITEIRDSATFLKCVNPCVGGYHDSRQGWWCSAYQPTPYQYCFSYLWSSTTVYSCNSNAGSCTVTRDQIPRNGSGYYIWTTYDTRSATGSFWTYFGSYGGDWHCNIMHLFITGRQDLVCTGGA